MAKSWVVVVIPEGSIGGRKEVRGASWAEKLVCFLTQRNREGAEITENGLFKAMCVVP